MNAVKTSGGLRERLFNAAYNAKKQAILNGNYLLTNMSYVFLGLRGFFCSYILSNVIPSQLKSRLPLA